MELHHQRANRTVLIDDGGQGALEHGRTILHVFDAQLESGASGVNAVLCAEQRIKYENPQSGVLKPYLSNRVA